MRFFYLFPFFFSNPRPLIVIGGSSDRDQENKGAFQEFPQVKTLNRYNLSVFLIKKFVNRKNKCLGACRDLFIHKHYRTAKSDSLSVLC